MKIMFVCHGNICRSPMAEFILRDMLKQNGLSGEVSVASCATSSEEIWGGKGNPVYPPAKAELAKHGIDCSGKTAVQLQKKDYKLHDVFICMDNQNYRNIQRIFGSDPDDKIRKLMDYTDRGGDVADPWYTRRFDVTYRDIHDGCEAIVERLLNGEEI